jgi:DNA-binding XRE family transcriptional regulator
MTAFAIHPIAETDDSVTLRRDDFEALIDLVADAQDLADIEAVKRRIAASETEVFPFEVAERLLDGDHPVRVFREHRSLGLRELAKAAGVSPSYLSEIEAGEKPGSVEFLSRVSAALGVSMDLLARRRAG